MTRMTSRTLDDDGNGVPGVYVYAQLQGSAWLLGHTAEVETEVITYTDPTGRWVLDLTPAAELEQTGTWWLVRIFQQGSVGLNVPVAPVGDGLVDITTPGVLRPSTDPPPDIPGYVTTDQLGAPNGVATLGPDGILTESQWPPATSQAFKKDVAPPATLVQVIHGFDWEPAGVMCLEDDGSEVEPRSITHPLTGVTEVGFGVPFSGTVYVS
jgi:hypothetical protein